MIGFDKLHFNHQLHTLRKSVFSPKTLRNSMVLYTFSESSVNGGGGGKRFLIGVLNSASPILW